VHRPDAFAAAALTRVPGQAFGSLSALDRGTIVSLSLLEESEPIPGPRLGGEVAHGLRQGPPGLVVERRGLQLVRMDVPGESCPEEVLDGRPAPGDRQA
jgi:hypothetical protein